MSKLSSYLTRRTLAKISLEDGLRHVNDFYWAIAASTSFAIRPDFLIDLVNFVSSQAEFKGQGRLRSENLQPLVASAQKELPKFGLIILFSYFESYLRDVCLSGLLANPGLVAEPTTMVDGETIAEDEKLVSGIQGLANRHIEGWLRGSYADRFGALRRVFGLPKDIAEKHAGVLDDYYAKRNCLVHRHGLIDTKAKKHFQSDLRNIVGGTVVVERSDFLRLHKSIHESSDSIDEYIVKNHIKNTEMLRLLYRLRNENPSWTAKDLSRELTRLRVPAMVSRNQIARLFQIPEA